MKTLLSMSALFAATAAQAHDSLVPHVHPHGVSPLPDLGSFLVGGIVVLALGLVAYTKFGRAP